MQFTHLQWRMTHNAFRAVCPSRVICANTCEHVRTKTQIGVKRVEEASRQLVGGLSMGIHRTCRDESPGMSGHGGSPEVLVKEMYGLGGARLAGEPRGMSLLQDIWPGRIRNKKTIKGP